MILHVDMDAFYASVEEREDPSLVGRPVVVGGSADGRGVVAAANYEARRFGVHSAMPAARAKRLCPSAVFIRPRLDFYAEVSSQIRAVFHRYTPLVEPLSLDEAFLDVTASESLFGRPAQIARRIKTEIAGELGLVASVGVASNKFIAKLASDLEKPDGLVEVVPGSEQAFLDPLPVGYLWGVGKASGQAFQAMGIDTVGALRRTPLDMLKGRFGRHGEHLWELAHGRDARRVIPDHQAKSISHETTFAQDIRDRAVLRSWMLRLTEQVARRLRRHGLSARTAQVKIRFDDFHTITRSKSFSQPTQLTQDLWDGAAALLEAGMHAERRAVRLIGMGASALQEQAAIQGDLFEAGARSKQTEIDSVVDSINDRFGAAGLRRGATKNLL